MYTLNWDDRTPSSYVLTHTLYADATYIHERLNHCGIKCDIYAKCALLQEFGRAEVNVKTPENGLCECGVSRMSSSTNSFLLSFMFKGMANIFVGGGSGGHTDFSPSMSGNGFPRYT